MIGNNKDKFYLKGYNYLLILSVILIGFSAFTLPFGLDTIWDEGFYIQWMKNKQNYSQVTQSFNIINKLTDFLEYDVYSIRLYRFFFQLTTVFAFVYVSGLYLQKSCNIKINKKYLIIVSSFFLVSFFIYSKVLCHRHLQQVFSLSGLVFILLSTYEEKKVLKYIYIFITSFFTILAIVNVPPSGVVMLLFFGLYLVIALRKKIKDLLLTLGLFTVGLLLSFLILNVFLVDFINVYPEILENAMLVTNGGSGHGYFDLLLPYIPFMKEGLFKISIVTANLILLYYLKIKWKSNFFDYIILTLNLIFIYFYPSYGIDFIYPIVLVFFYKLKQGNLKATFFSFEDVLLFLFPIVVTLGTNTEIFGLILFFIPAWGLLLCRFIIKADLDNSILNKVLITQFFIIVFVFYNSYFVDGFNTLGNIVDSRYTCRNLKPISRIYVRKEQARYFNKVERILNENNFVKNKDYMFSINSDQMTIHAFEGKLIRVPYHVLGSFMLDWNHYRLKKTRATRPKFIFLDKVSISVISKNNDWNFPQSYKKYYVGSPESYNTNYNSERWLFCSYY